MSEELPHGKFPLDKFPCGKFPLILFSNFRRKNVSPLTNSIFLLPGRLTRQVIICGHLEIMVL